MLAGSQSFAANRRSLPYIKAGLLASRLLLHLWRFARSRELMIVLLVGATIGRPAPLCKGSWRVAPEGLFNARPGGALCRRRRHLPLNAGEMNTAVSAVHTRPCPFGRIIRSYTKEFDVMGSAFTSRVVRTMPSPFGDGKPVDLRQGFPNTNAVSVGGSAQGRALLFVLFFRVKKST